MNISDERLQVPVILLHSRVLAVVRTYHLYLHYFVACFIVACSHTCREKSWKWIRLLQEKQSPSATSFTCSVLWLAFLALPFLTSALWNSSLIMILVVLLEDVSVQFSRLLVYRLKTTISNYLSVSKSTRSDEILRSLCYKNLSKMSETWVTRPGTLSDTQVLCWWTLIREFNTGLRKPPCRHTTSFSPLLTLPAAYYICFLSFTFACYFNQ